MLAFDVIKLEQDRVFHENATRLCLPEFPGSELSLLTRSSAGRKLSKLNRQIQELEPSVASRKRTAETCSNRQKSEKRLRAISASTIFPSAEDFTGTDSRKTDRPTRENEAFLQSVCTTSNRFWLKNRSYRKQRIKPCLTGPKTAFRETVFSSNFQIFAASLSDELRHHREAPHTPSQSSNLSRSHGRP